MTFGPIEFEPPFAPASGGALCTEAAVDWDSDCGATLFELEIRLYKVGLKLATGNLNTFLMCFKADDVSLGQSLSGAPSGKMQLQTMA